jgi:nitrile hydratase
VDGIHDLGGRQGFGGSLAERDEAAFHEAWEKRVFALSGVLFGMGCFHADEFRHAIERLDPLVYLRDGYWARWLGAFETLVQESGGGPTPGRVSDTSASRPVEGAPRFAVGAPVVTRNLHRRGHTRLPGYARARRGTIALIQGGWVLPDTNAHGQGECPEFVYAVRFSGEELWGEAAESGTSVHIDLFESYLEPA